MQRPSMIVYKTYLVMFLAAAVVAYCATPWVRRLAVRIGAFDQPGERKIHHEPMPRLGGVAVFAGFCLPWMLLYLTSNRVTDRFQNYEMLLAGLLGSALVMLAVGVYDDLFGLLAARKLLAQVLVATALHAAGFSIDRLSMPGGREWQLGLGALPVTLLWLVGITNAINLLDGIDGLAAGITACIALCLAVINIRLDNIIVAILALCLAGACIGFLPHNFYPARIFLGDSGSLFIGLVLAGISILSLFKTITAVTVAVPIILFAVPVFDTAAVAAGRLLRGDPVLQGDRTHIHHRLMQLGWSQRRTAIFLYTLTLATGAGAILFSLAKPSRFAQHSALVLCALFAGVWIWVRRQPRPPCP